MNAENKAKIIQFVREQLSNCQSNYQSAFDAIFNDRAYGNKAEKLAALKFLALYSSEDIGFVRQSAQEVLKLEGTPLEKIEMKLITWE